MTRCIAGDGGEGEGRVGEKKALNTKLTNQVTTPSINGTGREMLKMPPILPPGKQNEKAKLVDTALNNTLSTEHTQQSAKWTTSAKAFAKNYSGLAPRGGGSSQINLTVSIFS